MYTVHNGNLLYHGCVPLNEDGSFREVKLGDKTYTGKELYDVLENSIQDRLICPSHYCDYCPNMI